MTILILGGTAEARQLAAALVGDGLDVISSLAGRVNSPNLPPGDVRVGGFGGADGLTDYLRRQQVSAVVDATHPFAATISANAQQAANRTNTPLVRLERPRLARAPALRLVDLGDRRPCRTSCGRRCPPPIPYDRTAVSAGFSSLGQSGGAGPAGRSTHGPTAAALDPDHVPRAIQLSR